MKVLTATILISGFQLACFAEFTVNPLFTDRMVLQRDQDVAIYGTADDGETVSVSFRGECVSTTARNGNWRLFLSPKSAGGSYQMVVESRHEKVVLNDILVGDVWVLGGQSNMARPMRTYPWLMQQLPSLDMNPAIRWFKVKEGGVDLDEPSDEVVVDARFEDAWQISSRDLLPYFSPTGYFFSMQRYEMNNVPLGLIYACRGSTVAASWVPMSTLKKRPEYAEILDKELNNRYRMKDGKPNPYRPTALYNGTVHPLHRFTIKGVLWYQGETDSRESERYRLLFPDLIRTWREAWGQGDFPFVFAQISSTKDRNWSLVQKPHESVWAWLREAQTYALEEPNTAMIVTYDIGEWEDIHPQNKAEVGRRFALAVAALEGEPVVSSGPVYKSFRIEGDSIVLSFGNLHGGLEVRQVRMNKNKGFEPGTDPEAYIAPEDELLGFTICGSDGVFHEAQATLQDNEVTVRSDKVDRPVAARYAWRTFALANLYGKTGLPVLPFRTDDYPCPQLYRK